MYRALWLAATLAVLLTACAAPKSAAPTTSAPATPPTPASTAARAYPLVNRLSWGASTSAVAQFEQQGWQPYLSTQLHPVARKLAPELQAQLDGMTISATPLSPASSRVCVRTTSTAACWTV